MALRSLSPRDRRALMWLLAVVAMVGMFRLGFLPYRAYRAGLIETLSSEQALLVRERAILGESQGFDQRVEELESAVAAARTLTLVGTDAVAAGGALTAHVARTADRAGVMLQLAEQGEPEAFVNGGVIGHPVSVRLLGDLEGVLRFLHGLESGTPLLRVLGLSLRPSGVNDGDLEQGQLLTVAATVWGYRMAPRSDRSADTEPVPTTDSAGAAR